MGSEINSKTGTRLAQIVIADDHNLFRAGLKHLLGYEEDLKVVGEAQNGREAVALCRKLLPDLVLMDVRMPVMDGLQATRIIKSQQPEISVLIITTFEDQDYLLEAIMAGAAGYVLKDASNQRLRSSIRRALEGESPINQELATQLIQRLANEVPPPAEPVLTTETRTASPHSLSGELTSRELEVLQLVARGKTNQEIADRLYITKATAKVHVQHIVRKLGVSDRTQAVVRAFERGLAPYP